MSIRIYCQICLAEEWSHDSIFIGRYFFFVICMNKIELKSFLKYICGKNPCSLKSSFYLNMHSVKFYFLQILKMFDYYFYMIKKRAAEFYQFHWIVHDQAYFTCDIILWRLILFHWQNWTYKESTRKTLKWGKCDASPLITHKCDANPYFDMEMGYFLSLY